MRFWRFQQIVVVFPFGLEVLSEVFHFYLSFLHDFFKVLTCSWRNPALAGIYNALQIVRQTKTTVVGGLAGAVMKPPVQQSKVQWCLAIWWLGTPCLEYFEYSENVRRIHKSLSHKKSRKVLRLGSIIPISQMMWLIFKHAKHENSQASNSRWAIHCGLVWEDLSSIALSRFLSDISSLDMILSRWTTCSRSWCSSYTREKRNSQWPPKWLIS